MGTELANHVYSTFSAIRVIGFDHRKSVLPRIPKMADNPNLCFHVNIEKSSSTAVYEYFLAKLSETKPDQVT